MASEREPVKLQTLFEHLSELRSVLFRCAIALITSFGICFYKADQIVAFLKAPLIKVLPEEQKSLYYFGLTEQFYSYMKVSLVAALAITFPVFLIQFWIFVAPALKPNEKKLVLPFSLASIACFCLGFFVAYQFALPYVFQFLLNFSQASNELPLLRLGDYLTLCLQLLIGTALLFEIPVLLALLGKLGIVNAAFLKHFRPQAYVGLSVLAAVITPTPDAFSMILALIPLFLLYEISVVAVGLVSKEKEIK